MSTSHDLSDNDQFGRTNLADWQGLVDMIAVITEQVSAPVEGMHRAIVDRWFGIAGQRVDPVRRLVDGVTASIYRTVRLGGSVVASTISMASELASDRVSLAPVWETGKGRYVQSVLNGVWGDKLDEDKSPLRIELGLRGPSGITIPATPTSLSQAFPNPTGRLAMMIHGFGETERCWHSNNGSTLSEGLESDGFTVLGLRYNTGRAIMDNSSDLADLLEAVRAAWPIPVDELVLIGHSMGGLLARGAVVDGRSSEQRWVGLATHLVAIGTPHLGSPIEKGVHVIGKGLGLFNETRPLATFLESRSAGIKDLRHGADHKLDGVQYHVIAGAITTETTHPFGHLVGDLVVGVSSATGRGRRHHVPSSSVLVLGGRNHADLLRDPEVISHVRRCLSPSLWPGSCPQGQQNHGP